MKPAPCMNCEEKALGCHSKCKRYQAYKEYREEINQRRRNDDLRRSASYSRLRLGTELSRRRTQQHRHQK